MPCVLAMGLAVRALFAVLFFFNAVVATPTPDFLTSLDLGYDNSASPYLALFSEKLCHDMTDKFCRDRGGYGLRYSVYDPISESCICSTQPSSYMVRVSPLTMSSSWAYQSKLSKLCGGMTCTSQDEKMYYWPWTGDCFCESHDFLAQSWNVAKEKSEIDYGSDIGFRVRPAEQFGLVKQKMDAFNDLATEIEEALGEPQLELRMSRLREISKRGAQKREGLVKEDLTGTSVNGPIPSFLPPPSTEITPELLNQSLSVQPNNTATISSVLINIPQGVVTVTFQMNGLGAASLTLNASTSMMCGSIGTAPEPDIEITPTIWQGQGANNGSNVADCLCIAVNMYNVNVINFWVMDTHGVVYALVSSNKIVNIDQLQLGQSKPLSLVPIPAGSQNQKRDTAAAAAEAMTTPFVPLRARQVLKVGCGNACPFAYMHQVVSADGHVCGCVFEHGHSINTRTTLVVKRDNLIAQKASQKHYSTTLSKEECETMRCSGSGDSDSGKTAVLNPLSKVCWCVEPDY